MTSDLHWQVGIGGYLNEADWVPDEKGPNAGPRCELASCEARILALPADSLAAGAGIGPEAREHTTMGPAVAPGGSSTRAVAWPVRSGAAGLHLAERCSEPSGR